MKNLFLTHCDNHYLTHETDQYYTTSGLPSRKLEPNICAVCGNKIIVLDNAEAIVEKTYKLNCDHMYL